MEHFFQFWLWLISLAWISIAFEVIPFTSRWGRDCPSECQCHVIAMSQTLLSRWQHQKGQAKTAMCIFQNHRLNAMTKLPYDTEVFTFFQALDGSDMVLTSHMTDTLQNVKSMDLQGSLSNAKLHITDDIFHNMLTLKYLSLHRIDLTGAEKAFSKLQSLEVLQVLHCNVGYLKWDMLDGLTMLKELYLIQSGIKELYDFAFYGTPELRRLFLSHNELFSVDADAFVGLLKLEHLDLSNNRIDHLSGLTFPPMPHLQWLELKHNPIRVIFPHCFQFLNGTQHLTLGHKYQSVHLMKFSFRGLFSLIFLHIPNIDNDAVNEHMFYGLQSLLHLNLQGRIKMLNDRSFNGAHRVLQKLILHNCQLEKISEDAFHGLGNLITLDISSNLLGYLPVYIFESLETLQELILSDNKFMLLPSDLFLPLQHLRALRLDANPWNCTCEMSTWKEELVTKMPQFVSNPCVGKVKAMCAELQTSYTEDMNLLPRCVSPSLYQGQSVFEVMKILHCGNFH